MGSADDRMGYAAALGTTAATALLGELERLSLENERLRAMFESAPDGYIETDAGGVIVSANREAERMLGYARGELVGRTVEELVPPGVRELHVSLRERFSLGPPREMGRGRNLVAQRRDGTTLPVEIRLAATVTPSGTRVVASLRDVSERRRQEEQLQDALQARDVLLREVYHRVKNNLQVVSSLLRWHARDAADQEVSARLEDAHARIRAMAAVHESLMSTANASCVGFASYVRELVDGLHLSQRMPHGEIAVSLEIDESLAVPLDRAVPCGLIVHELVSNAFEHAFPPQWSPPPEGRRIAIALTQSGERLALVVADNGVGRSPEASRRRGSLGLELVRILARQVGGELLLYDGNGTRAEVRCQMYPLGAPP